LRPTHTRDRNMKKILLFTICIALLTVHSYAQFSAKADQKAIIEQYKDFYKVDGQNVIFTKIIDSISGTPSEIYTKVITYMAMAYRSANDVIQQQDKEAGLVIGRGIFSLTPDLMTCQHSIRFDIKENKVRVIVYAEKYIYTNTNSDFTKYAEVNLIDSYPFSTNNYFGMVPTQRFVADNFIILCETIQNTFSNIENSLKSQSTINNNW